MWAHQPAEAEEEAEVVALQGQEWVVGWIAGMSLMDAEWMEEAKSMVRL